MKADLKKTGKNTCFIKLRVFTLFFTGFFSVHLLRRTYLIFYFVF